MTYHTLIYDNKISKLPNICNNVLDKNKKYIITCNKCKEKEGYWLFEDGYKIWIPNNHCPNLNKKLKIGSNDFTKKYNLEAKDNLDYGIDIDTNVKHLCNLSLMIKNDNTQCYFNVNELTPHLNENDIICNIKNGSKNTLVKIDDYYHNGHCLGQKVNIIETLDKQNKITNCKSNKDECNNILNTKIKLNYPILNVSPECFYKIPIKNHPSLQTKKILTNIGETTLHGFNCNNNINYRGLLFIKKKIYLITNNLIYTYKLNKNNFISINKQPINIIFPNLPNQFDSIFYFKHIQSIILLKDEYLYKYSIKKKKILFKRKINKIWYKIPYPCKLVYQKGDNLVFIKDNKYYIVNLFNYITLQNNIYFLKLDDYNSINNYYQASKVANSFNGEILHLDYLEKNKNNIEINNINGWLYDSNYYTYSIRNLNNKKKIYKTSNTSNNGIWSLINPDMFIIGGRCFKKGYLNELGCNIDSTIDIISYSHLNNSYYIIKNDKYIKLSNLNCRKCIKYKPLKIIFSNIDSNKINNTLPNLNEIKNKNKEYLEKIKVLYKTKLDLKQSKENRIKNKNIHIESRSNYLTIKNESLKNLKKNIMTKDRLISQQESSVHNINNKIKYLFYIFIILLISILTIIIYRTINL